MPQQPEHEYGEKYNRNNNQKPLPFFALEIFFAVLKTGAFFHCHIHILAHVTPNVSVGKSLGKQAPILTKLEEYGIIMR